MWTSIALILSHVAYQASAHGGCLNYTVGETWYPGYDPYGPEDQLTAPWTVQRKWVTVDPIFEADNISLPCNAPGNPANAYIPITAGENFTAVYYSWVHQVGPMVAWMADCNGDCKTVEPHKLDWFKIGEEGLLSGTLSEGIWFQRAFSNWEGLPSLWSERIPETLRPGKYLIRHEIIALHSENKPQWYPECAHLEVKGTGKSYPSKEYMAKIPGVYNMNQPEININVYAPENLNKTVYKIPGPPVWTG